MGWGGSRRHMGAVDAQQEKKKPKQISKPEMVEDAPTSYLDPACFPLCRPLSPKMRLLKFSFFMNAKFKPSAH